MSTTEVVKEKSRGWLGTAVPIQRRVLGAILIAGLVIGATCCESWHIRHDKVAAPVEDSRP